MNKNLKTLLIKSGWKENRRKCTVFYMFFLKKEGYFFNKVIQDFLSKFGGLTIYFEKNGMLDSLHFNVYKAVNNIDSRWVKDAYSKILKNNKLCVIGEANHEHMTLIMSDEGKVYGGFGDCLYFLGENGVDAINSICFLDNKSIDLYPDEL